MKVELTGTGGPDGWPSDGCASCRSVGRERKPLSVVVDDNAALDGYELARTDDGDIIIGPDGGSLLFANGDGGTGPGPGFDLVLIDLLDDPFRLGALRSRGLVNRATRVVAVGLDHRVRSEAELDRRLAYWGAVQAPDGTVLETSDRAAHDSSKPHRMIVLGGTRSGKSEEAEMRLAGEPDVLYVATGDPHGDAAWTDRITAHQNRRPAHWRTRETRDLEDVLATETGSVLIDGLGTWLAGVFDELSAWEDPGRVRGACDGLVAAWRSTRARVALVSDEVGLGVVPEHPSGRIFRDTLGELNHRLADESEEAALVVAGRVTSLP
ncbi:bifunctional adenosylcobinamide kinase/adenosylcobinamide-phosphate guanylyltransferase [Herbidospora mongoliensis]|uniref:bifunctional adenosylcobinamide kinase/adenosylcobinamide-phosphate guanylyltransferase n=1 Tax=Herbidospora mongoliensis TaxID=688067 RepID=UPI000A5909F8|nr:bifunctional adenosylcobinamide kinase/adenosylcobinamide-phosphate guanylyltransferase [Herbidospora mongoliensis]